MIIELTEGQPAFDYHHALTVLNNRPKKEEVINSLTFALSLQFTLMDSLYNQ